MVCRTGYKHQKLDANPLGSAKRPQDLTSHDFRAGEKSWAEKAVTIPPGIDAQGCGYQGALLRGGSELGETPRSLASRDFQNARATWQWKSATISQLEQVEIASGLFHVSGDLLAQSLYRRKLDFIP